MVPKISNFHYLGLKELKCAVVCYFQGFLQRCVTIWNICVLHGSVVTQIR